jgi:CRP-like cAMP-binding protein
MPQQQAETIAGHFQEKEFSKNDLLLKEGKVCNDYYFFEEGFARAYTFNLQGDEVTTAFYSPRGVVCELFSFFKRIPSGESIQALTDCKTWHLNFEQLQEVFHNMLLFREFGRTILVTAYADLKRRMLSSLHQTAEERYAYLIQTNPDIFQHVPLKQIASYLGITDTSLSRIRKEFSKHTAS